MAVQFYFGTSEGSVAKSEQIERIVGGPAPQIADGDQPEGDEG